KLDGVTVVDVHHVAAVPFRRHGAGALVQDGTGLRGRACETPERGIPVPVVRDIAADQVAELAAVRQVVDDHHALAACTQRAHDVAADEARAAGDDDHGTASALGTRSGSSSRYSSR